MRIGLDARTLALPRPRGTGRNLLDAYRIIPRLRPEWEFVLYHQRPVHASDPLMELRCFPNITLRQIDMPGDRLDAWFQVRLPIAALLDRLNVLHLPANAAPWWCPVTTVVTIHDLAPLVVAGEATRGERAAFRRGVKRALSRAAHLITVSNATRIALHETFDVMPTRTSVIHWAPDTHIAAQAQQELSLREQRELEDKYGVRGRWLISFSGRSPRKNARGVLSGFAAVTPAERRDVQVVLVGCEPAAQRQALQEEAERLGIGDQCRLLGFVPHEDLPTLLKGAAGLLMPSLHEGFGLPILDALVCGVPVLTSRRSSMPEIAGDAAVYCDPENVESIAGGIERLLDGATADRLIAAGAQRAKLFNWERTAEAMCDVYAQCLGHGMEVGQREQHSVMGNVSIESEVVES